MQKHQVQALLMGGQACVFYGAAQFSKDINLLLLADEANFAGLRSALDELGAHRIAVPGFDPAALARGACGSFPLSIGSLRTRARRVWLGSNRGDVPVRFGAGAATAREKLVAAVYDRRNHSSDRHRRSQTAATPAGIAEAPPLHSVCSAVALP